MADTTPRDKWLGPKGTPERDEADKRSGLRLARDAARKQDLAESTRDNAIRLAHRSGASLREIAEVTGLGHMTVKRIIDRSPQQQKG